MKNLSAHLGRVVRSGLLATLAALFSVLPVEGAQRYGDMVQEQVSAPGTSSFTLGTARSGFLKFSSVPSISTGDTVDYLAIDVSGSPWEIGVGTYSAGSLARTTIIANSSGSTSVVNFTGTTYVVLTNTAERFAAFASLASGALQTSNLGSGVQAALGVAVGSAGAPLVNGGALGTPSSGVLTNATGLPISTGLSGMGTGVAAGLANAATGNGSPVLATSPSLTGTPTAPTATAGTSTTQLATTAFVQGQGFDTTSARISAIASALPSATSSQLYGGTAAAGGATPITIGSNLSLSGGTLTGTYSYTLPSATSSTLGGVTVSTGLNVSSGALSVVYGTTSGTAAQGNDSRITGALQTSSLGTGVSSALSSAVTGSGGIMLSTNPTLAGNLIITGGGNIFSAATSSTWSLSGGNANGNGGQISLGGSTSSVLPGEIGFNGGTGSTNSQFGLFDSSGNFGVGTTGPGGYSKVALQGGKLGTGTSSLALITPGAAISEVADLALYSTFGSTTDVGPRRTADIVAAFNAGTWGNEYLAFNVGYGGTANDSRYATIERARLNSTGLGIGTTSPAYKLDVAGPIRIPNNTPIYMNDTGGTARRMLYSYTNNFYVGDTDNAVSGSNNAYGANNAHTFYVNGATEATISSTGLSLTNALPVTSGGTGTATTFTAGSALYAGTGGIYAQDNSNFFYDATNKSLGVGTNNPASPFGVPSGLTVYKSTTGEAATVLVNTTSGSTATVSLHKIGGTGNSFVNDVLYDNAASPYYQHALGSAVNYEQWYFGSTLGMRLSNTGNLSIGTTQNNSKLEVLNNQLYTGYEGAQHGFQILTGMSSSDYTLFGGADATNHVSYLQSVNWGTAKAPLLLNPQGGNVGIGSASTPAQLTVVGYTQATNAPSTSTGLGGSAILGDAGTLSNSGGMLLFGANGSNWLFGAVKGLVTDGSNNSRGDIVIATRRNNTDTTLTESLRVAANGTTTAYNLALTNALPISSGGTGQTSFTMPTQTIKTSGSGTYTVPTGVLWLRVRMVGGGGGGSGSGTGSPGTGGTGGNTTFGTSFLVANGGTGGQLSGITYGGSASIGSGATGISGYGGSGSSSNIVTLTSSQTFYGGAGGSSMLGGNGAGGSAAGGTGGGGGGGGLVTTAVTNGYNGGGGGAGGFVDAIISSPASSYSYAVGAAGVGGTNGTSGTSGNSGGSGILIIEEHYMP